MELNLEAKGNILDNVLRDLPKKGITVDDELDMTCVNC